MLRFGGALLGALTLLAVVAAPSAAQVRGASCRQICADTFDQALLAGPCGACAGAPLSDRDACLGVSADQVDFCLAACPGIAGRCEITRDCLAGCRDRGVGDRGVCHDAFKRRVRRCENGRNCLAEARSQRRACVRDCRRSALVASVPVAPVPQAGCNCQSDCVRKIIGECLDECDDRCEGDQQALALCRGACRDADCDQLERRCIEDGGASGAYEVCCTACGNCQGDVDCEAIPTTTSTTRSTVTTTTSTASSTTTTLPF
jgi:hypothetical protein